MSVVVGAAIVRHGRVLAARRSAPATLAGGWEFAGGKVEPGETEEHALVRECAEELGVRVRLGERIGPDTDLPGGRTLKVWLATIESVDGADSAEPRALQEHDELRWLAPDRLAGVEWLPADWPIVHSLGDLLAESTPLAGGRVGGALQVGDTVRRPTGAWTPAVHDLLRHVDSAGVPAVPDLLGLDAAGREVLRFVPGRTVGDADPVPADFHAPSLAEQVGAWLRSLHDATADFGSAEREWRRGRLARRDGQVVCHNDVSPDNVVIDDAGTLLAVLDWDMAAPGDARDDLAFAAWQFVLRHSLPVADEAAGLHALASGYGLERTDPVAVLDRVAPRLRGAVRFMRRGAASGDEGLQRLLTTGIPEATEAGVESVLRRRDELVGLLRRA
jgi:8-oxo-dGTP diphosphatase